MKQTIMVSEKFGSFCSNGQEAVEFLSKLVIPSLDQQKQIIFDFRNVKNINSSFSNALFANLVIQKGEDVFNCISFVNCRDNIKLMISSSLDYGIGKHKKEAAPNYHPKASEAALIC